MFCGFFTVLTYSCECMRKTRDRIPMGTFGMKRRKQLFRNFFSGHKNSLFSIAFTPRHDFKLLFQANFENVFPGRIVGGTIRISWITTEQLYV